MRSGRIFGPVQDMKGLRLIEKVSREIVGRHYVGRKAESFECQGYICTVSGRRRRSREDDGYSPQEHYRLCISMFQLVWRILVDESTSTVSLRRYFGRSTPRRQCNGTRQQGSCIPSIISTLQPHLTPSWSCDSF
jgi:hypothetical protein